MPYAHNGKISQAPIEGGIEITDQQYQEALAGMLEGKEVSIADGFRVELPIDPEQEPAPEPTFDESKKAKLAAINAACLSAIDGGFEHEGHVYDSDLISRTNIIGTSTGVSAGVPLPDGFTWRTHDNENVPMDGAGVIALGAALLQHVNAQYAISWQLKADIEAATTPEELDAIRWPQ